MGILDSDFQLIIRLIAAAIFGGILGLEREFHGKEAGLRTYSLVSLGSALVMLVSIHMYETYRHETAIDPGRIAAQVITGIGFLGAGTIIQSRQGIKGLTTAAGIWTSSGIGLACGMGYFRAAIVAMLTALLVLTGFSWLGRKMGSRDV